MEVETAGATFGCTLGNIVGYLEGRGIPAERAYILRSMRTLLLPAAEAVRYMRGTDVEHLARGMASCRVVQPQRAALHEVNLPEFPTLDHKYGHACTVVGGRRSLLCGKGWHRWPHRGRFASGNASSNRASDAGAWGSSCGSLWSLRASAGSSLGRFF